MKQLMKSIEKHRISLDSKIKRAYELPNSPNKTLLIHSLISASGHLGMTLIELRKVELYSNNKRIKI